MRTFTKKSSHLKAEPDIMMDNSENYTSIGFGGENGKQSTMLMSDNTFLDEFG